MKIELTAKINAGLAEELLQKLKTNFENMQEVWHRIGDFAKSEVIENVNSGGRPTPFKPLSSGYERWKKKQGYGDQILIRRGKLRNSFHFRADNKGVRIYTNLKYAGAHQEGKGVPQRPFMPYAGADDIPPGDKQSIEKIQDILVQGLMRGV